MRIEDRRWKAAVVLYPLVLLSAAALVAGCGWAHPPDRPLDPHEVPESLTKRAESQDGMVATAHPLASQAGVEMLQRGGNAVDAAVAAAFAVAVVEPMMSGLGGSGAMTLWNHDERHADYVDYYAQVGADPDHEYDSDPSSLLTQERMVAIPGMVAGLLEALERYGTLSPEEVLAPAIRIAEDGFIIHGLLGRIIEEYEDRLTYDEAAKAIFYPDEKPLQAGDMLVQPALARTLQRVSDEGVDGFYRGEIAENLIDRLSHGNSRMTLDDLANYRPRWRGALCGTYGGYTVLTAPPPLAGKEVLLALNLLEGKRMGERGLPMIDGDALSYLVDAIRIARADRNRWMGDPDFADVPVAGLISREYAETRIPLMNADVPVSMIAGDPRPFAGEVEQSEVCQGAGLFHHASTLYVPEGDFVASYSTDELEEQHTTHISVVDGNGNAVSVTNTLGLYFGASVFSDGVFYNSTARNFGREEPNLRVAHRTAHSSTAPTIVLGGDEVRLVVGSPGSGRIPPAVFSMILYTLDYGLDPADAVQMPRVYPFTNSRTVEIEGGIEAGALRALRERGYDLRMNPPVDMYFGGVHMIMNYNGTLIGVADPRREGSARGL